MEDSQVRKVGTFASVIGLALFLFIAIGFIKLKTPETEQNFLNQAYAEAGLTTEMVKQLQEGNSISLNLIQLNTIYKGIRDADTWNNVLQVSVYLWVLSCLFGLAVFLVNIKDNTHLRLIATLIFLEDVLALLPIAATFTKATLPTVLAYCSLLVIACIAILVLGYVVGIAGKHAKA